MLFRSSRRKREKLGPEAGKKTARSNGTWIEAVLEKNGSAAQAPTGALRIYFAAGAYCQISTTAEAALAAELLGRLGAKR